MFDIWLPSITCNCRHQTRKGWLARQRIIVTIDACVVVLCGGSTWGTLQNRLSSWFSDDNMIIFRRFKLRFIFSSFWLSQLCGFVIVHCFFVVLEASIIHEQKLITYHFCKTCFRNGGPYSPQLGARSTSTYLVPGSSILYLSSFIVRVRFIVTVQCFAALCVSTFYRLNQMKDLIKSGSSRSEVHWVCTACTWRGDSPTRESIIYALGPRLCIFFMCLSATIAVS